MALPVPVEILQQHVIALGKTRSGKSSKLRVLVEYLIDQQKPVCILDAKGDWWGLKSSADGKRPGYPVVIFGGKHADVPITGKAGKAVAEIVASTNQPCLVDLKGMTVSDRNRFFIDFAEALFDLHRGYRYLVIPECHNFAPQGAQYGDTPMMLHWANRLASEGAGLGITLLSDSQRPAKVHKDYLTSHETLIACRVQHNLDRKAYQLWIDGCGDPVIGKQMVDELAGMERAESWVWSPEIKYGPQRVRWPLFKTYDSFKPQETGDAVHVWAKIDVDSIRGKLADVVQEAEKNDPAALRKTIAELQKQVRQQNSKIYTQADLDREVRAAFSAALVSNPIETASTTESAGKAFKALQKIIDIAHGAMQVPREMLSGTAQPRKHVESGTPATPYQPIPRSSKPSGGPEQRILNALAWWESTGAPGPYSKVQVAVMAEYSPGSGAFNNPLGKLRSSGLVDYPVPGKVALTDAGRAQADSVSAPISNKELHEKIMARLGGPEQKILAPLLDAYPDTITKEALARASGYSPGSGAFNNPCGKLRSLGLIDYPRPGQAVALPILFIGEQP